MRHEPWIEGRGDDIARTEHGTFAVECGHHLIGHFSAREFGNRFGSGNLHCVVDRRRLNVECAAEDEGKTQHVVDLVWVVGTPCRHDGVGAHSVHVVGVDFRIGIGHCKNERLVRHRDDHIARHDARCRETQKYIGAFHDFCELARFGLLRKRGLVRIHQFGAAFVDNTFNVGDENVFPLEADLQQQVEAGERCSTRPRAHKLYLGDIFANNLQAVENAGRDHNRRTMLVVVEHGNVEQLFEPFFDDEAVRRLDVFEVDAAERGPEISH